MEELVGQFPKKESISYYQKREATSINGIEGFTKTVVTRF
jgi:hypothetical protein